MDSLSRLSKPCYKCDRELPIEEYDRDSSKPDGYKAVCKQCRSQITAAHEYEKSVEILKTLDQKLIAALVESKSGGTDLPHIAELYQVITKLLGGVEGVGQQFLSNYLAAKPGSLTRERMLANYLKMGTLVSDGNKVEMPVELMSDQDLQNEIENRKKAMKPEIPTTVEVIDVKPQ